MFTRSLLNSDTQLNQHQLLRGQRDSDPRPAAPLQGTVQADVVVVGGGFAGLSCRAGDGAAAA